MHCTRSSALLRPAFPAGLALLAALLGACGGGGSGGARVAASSGVVVTADVQHNLDVLNSYRATVGSPPLVIDAQLSFFAQSGSEELMQDHVPHKHFRDADAAGTLFVSDGFHTQAGENQGDPNGWPPAASVAVQIDQILQAMWAEGPGGGHYENMRNPAFRRLGVGLVQDANGRLYFTNDFSD